MEHPVVDGPSVTTLPLPHSWGSTGWRGVLVGVPGRRGGGGGLGPDPHLRTF